MDFDPYAEWLRIAVRHRPPNHYELLGLPDFTDDTEAIRAAGMQRSGHVRKFCLGQNGDDANRILGEVAGAMVCLTDPDRKRQYDQTLRGATTVAVPTPARDTLVDASLAPAPASTPVKPAAPEEIASKPRIATEPLPPSALPASPTRPMLGRGPDPVKKPVSWRRIVLGRRPVVWLVLGPIIGLMLLDRSSRDHESTVKVDSPKQGESFSATPLPGPLAPATTSWPTQAEAPVALYDWPAEAPPPALSPFDSDQARADQEAWAAHLGVPVEYTNSIGMKLVLIPPGEFLMGSTAWEGEAQPHNVILTQPVYLGVHEVTQSQYAKVMGQNPSSYAATGRMKAAVVGIDTSTHPVEMVSWNDAAEFCIKLSEKEKLKPFYIRSGETVTMLEGAGYHLPTEAEWEFCCRSGSTTRYWTDDRGEDLPLAAWFGSPSRGRTHAVGELEMNPFGLFDIHGNTWEWVQDWWEPTYYAPSREKPAIDPSGPASAGSRRVYRGGGWDTDASNCRSSLRGADSPASRRDNVGFRVALAVDAVKAALAEPKTTPALAESPVASYDWPGDAPPPALAPFDADHARAHQEAWAAHLSAPVVYTNSIGMKFVLIPPGEFLMGSNQVEVETPQHKVILTQPVYLGVHEVTQAQYEKIMGQSPSHFAATGAGKDAVAGLETSTHPVEMVSWNNAAEFCAKLSENEKLKAVDSLRGETAPMLEGAGYRLPTEAQWEFACRAGTTTNYWTGDRDDDLVQVDWFGANSGNRTHATGELKANPFGLYDTHGNVLEWVQDWWEPAYYAQFTNKPAIDPSGPASARSLRVLRGGDWPDIASNCRASRRLAVVPPSRPGPVGFRVALTVDAVKAAIAESKKKPASAEPPVGGHDWPADAPPPALAPFSAAQAQAHQDAWAAHLGVLIEHTNTIGMKFVLIPPGEFLMGSNQAEGGAPQHKVILTKPIYLGIHEVTQAQYKKVMGQNPSHFAATGAGKFALGGTRPGSQRRRPGLQQSAKGSTADFPVEMVSWNDAAEFCAKLSENEKLKPCYVRSGATVTMLEGTGYRLPTEAEWEFACRAGTTANYWTGDQEELLAEAEWFELNSGRHTHAAGELKENPFGLYDIHGNVGEWVQDLWESTYYEKFREEAAINPGGPPPAAGSLRVTRGGGWDHNAPFCRASYRNASEPSYRSYFFGFRVVFVVDGSRAGR